MLFTFLKLSKFFFISFPPPPSPPQFPEIYSLYLQNNISLSTFLILLHFPQPPFPKSSLPPLACELTAALCVCVQPSNYLTTSAVLKMRRSHERMQLKAEKTHNTYREKKYVLFSISIQQPISNNNLPPIKPTLKYLLQNLCCNNQHYDLYTIIFKQVLLVRF